MMTFSDVCNPCAQKDGLPWNDLSGIKMAMSSVKVTSYPDQKDTNPEPISFTGQSGCNGFLSSNMLKKMTGASDLESVKTLDICVNANETSIGSMGGMIPNLEKLKLINSFIPSIRDLGTGFSNLQYLSLPRCGVEDLDGISCFYSLQELYLAYNEINDLSPLSLLETLQALDLEGNNIDDISQVEFLGFCSSLTSLVLEGNPVEMAPQPNCAETELKDYNYRASILAAIPNLKYLDDEPVIFEMMNGERVLKSSNKPVEKNSHASREGIIVQDSLKYSQDDDVIEQGDDGDIPVISRPSTAAGRRPQSAAAAAAGRSGHSERPGFSDIEPRPGSSGRPASVQRTRSPQLPDYISNNNYLAREELDDSSDLTHGSRQVLCGNPVRALLSRRKELTTSPHLERQDNYSATKTVKTDRFLRQNTGKFVAEHSYLSHQEESESREDVLKELKQWRETFAINSTQTEDKSTSKHTTEGEHRSETGKGFSPTPPPLAPFRAFEAPAHGAQSLSHPGASVPERPGTVASFRTRRYRSGGLGTSIEDGSKPVSGNSFSNENPHNIRLSPITSMSVQPVPPDQTSDRTRTSNSPKKKSPVKSVPDSEMHTMDPTEFRPVTAMAALQRTRLNKHK